MRLTRLKLENWRNFTEVDIPLESRVFILGGNGLGKSNLLDALRFLRDIAKGVGGGLQDAIERRGGIGRIRSLFARTNPVVTISVEAEDDADDNGDNGEPTHWHYHLTLRQEQRGARRIFVDEETVTKNGQLLLSRPDKDDKADTETLTQTALEQTSANKEFRPLAKFFQDFRYLHMVPQLVRHAADFQGRLLPDDPFGQDLLNAMAKLPEGTRKSRLSRVSAAIRHLKPRFGEFEYTRDEITGLPHLRFRFKDWRRDGSMQDEEQLSDGELRLIGLVWTLLESNEVIMLEEPEISFNEGIVGELPGIFGNAVLSRKKGGTQIFLTTHSTALLRDEGIAPEEVVLLTAENERTKVTLASEDKSIVAQAKAGLSIADSVLPLTQSKGSDLRRALFK